MAQLPQFAAASTIDKIQTALANDIITYPAYVYIRGSKHLAFIDSDNSINEIVGNNPKQVEKVKTLPAAEDAQQDVLYILDGIVYVFDGTDFNPMYKDVSDELAALDERVTALEARPTMSFVTKAAFPEIGEANVLYIATDEPNIYMWDGADYAPCFVDSSPVIEWIEL